MEVVIVAGLVATAAAGVWGFRIFRLSKKVNQRLPGPYSLMWVKPDTAPSDSQGGSGDTKRQWNKDMAEAAAIGAAGSLPTFYYLSQLDENVLDAMTFAFSKDLSNFHDLHDYINEKYLEILETESAEGWLTRLEGYVNEQYAADVLTKLGNEVEFPSSPNQEGWDLLVNGEPWQVKGGESPSVIAEHLAENPDIPVVTSAELKSYFPDHDQVLGFKELDPDLIHETTERTLNAADHLGDSVGVGVPVVALITSTFRELKLLNDGKTDLLDSAKHVGLDVAGTGGGGLIGAKMGAAIGAPLGPSGMAVFGGLGAVFGAIFGRSFTNRIKQREFKRALEDYQNALLWSKEEMERTLEQKRQEMIDSVMSINEQLNKAREEIIQQYQTEFFEWKESYIEKQRKFLAILPDILIDIKRQLQEIERQELGKIQPSGFFKRYIAPTEQDLFYRNAKKWFATRYRLLDAALDKLAQMPSDEKDVELRFKEIVRFFRKYQCEHAMLSDAFEDLLNIDRELSDAYRKKLFFFIDRSEQSVRKQLKRVLADLKSLVMEIQMILESSLNRLIEEGEKLGIDVRKYLHGHES